MVAVNWTSVKRGYVVTVADWLHTKIGMKIATEIDY